MSYEPEYSEAKQATPQDVTLDSIAQNARDAVNRLAELVEYLAKRLSPVLRDSDPTPSAALLAAQTGVAPLTSHLTETVQAIEAVQRQVSSIMERVDLAAS